MATRIWTGTTGSWTNPALWLPSGGGIPQTGDTSLMTTGDVTLTGLSLSAQSIILSGSNGGPVLELQGTTLDSLSSLTALTINAAIDVVGRSEIDGSLEFGSSGTLGIAASSSLVLRGPLIVDAPSSDGGIRTVFDVATAATLDIESTATITRPLTIVCTNASTEASGTVLNNGAITVIGTSVIFYRGGGVSADLSGSGTFTLKSATANFNATSAAQTIAFDPSGNSGITLAPSDLTSGAFKASITGFNANDSIYLGTSLVDAVSYDPVTHVLTTSYSGIQTGALTILGTYLTSNFILTMNAYAGGILTTNVVCFASGTRISTMRGAVAVEDLRVGDMAITATGVRPIVWLGRRDVDCTAQAYPLSVWPVRVLAGAFGADLPCRDLYLSPEHAVFAQGVLIPVSELINGASIFSVARERVTYWHVELDAHDIISAEGLPVESYMENGNRQDFDGQGSPGEDDCFTPPCAPIVRQGLIFEAVCRSVESALLQLEIQEASL